MIFDALSCLDLKGLHCSVVFFDAAIVTVDLNIISGTSEQVCYVIYVRLGMLRQECESRHVISGRLDQVCYVRYVR